MQQQKVLFPRCSSNIRLNNNEEGKVVTWPCSSVQVRRVTSQKFVLFIVIAVRTLKEYPTKLSVKFKFHYPYTPTVHLRISRMLNDCQLRGRKRITEHFAEFKD
jgi:hypothetical protein